MSTKLSVWGGGQTGGKLTFVVDGADVLLALDVPQSHRLVMGARQENGAVHRH